MKKTIGVFVLGIAAAGCRGPLAVVNEAAPDPNAPAWTRAANLTERTTAVADAAARQWGGSPDDVDGWTIRYTARPIAQSGDSITVGATEHESSEVAIWVGPGDERACLETTALAHEIGHVIIGDHDHKDRRWRDGAFWDGMTARLIATVPPSDAACLAQLAWPGGAGTWD